MRLFRYAAAAAVIGLAGCTAPDNIEGTDLAGKFNGYYKGYFDTKDCQGLTGQSTRIDTYVDNGRLIGKADGILLDFVVSDDGTFIATEAIDKDDLSNAWLINRDYFRIRGKIADGVIQATALFGSDFGQASCPEDGPITVVLKKE